MNINYFNVHIFRLTGFIQGFKSLHEGFEMEIRKWKSESKHEN